MVVYLLVIIIMIISQISSLIAKFRFQADVDKQIHVLCLINSGVPKSLQLKMPPLLTNDYVSRALDIIEDRILPHHNTITNTIP